MKSLLHIRQILLLGAVLLSQQLYSVNVFKLPASPSFSANVNINTSNDTTINLSQISVPIYGLSLDVNINKLSSRYFVRVILEDDNGKKYSVLEMYPEISEDDSMSLYGYCEETSRLDGILPSKLHVYVIDAEVNITSVNALYGTTSSLKYNNDTVSYRELQVKEIVGKINEYNESHNKLWAAGVTRLSLENYSDRMRILGITDSTPTNGIEYYIGGVFELGDESATGNTAPISNYVGNFDWRDRHGKNWLTSVKHQGKSGYCAAFAAVGALEGIVNLYYNHKYDLDLSEQEAACCSNNRINRYHSGMSPFEPIAYIKSHGICDEDSYPFMDDSLDVSCRSGQIEPQELVRISGYHYVTHHDDSIKSALIKHGPMSSGFWFRNKNNVISGGHSMALVGYGVIKLGDKFSCTINGGMWWQKTVREGDPRIGKTYWIFKDSYGDDIVYEHDGYMYLMYDTLANMVGPYRMDVPIVSMNRTDDDIVCEDSDGDGYYYWGIGPKPASCPAWVPDTPDGDDSNCKYGPMDSFGNLKDLESESIGFINITDTVSYDTRSYVYKNILIKSNAKLYLSDIVTLYPTCKIVIEANGELIIDGGTLNNAEIQMYANSTMTIINGGKVNFKAGLGHDIPLGASLHVVDGEINCSD